MFSASSSDLRGDLFFSNKVKKLFLRPLIETGDSLDDGDVEVTDFNSAFTSTCVPISDGSGSGSTATTSMLGNDAVGEEDSLGAGESTCIDFRSFTVSRSFNVITFASVSVPADSMRSTSREDSDVFNRFDSDIGADVVCAIVDDDDGCDKTSGAEVVLLTEMVASSLVADTPAYIVDNDCFS